jgi:cysteinyl-tRNA synthetase
LRELASILGFTLKKPDKKPIDPESLIAILLTIRSELRQAKQWELADVIRQRMADIGIVLEDTPKGTIWKRSK